MSVNHLGAQSRSITARLDEAIAALEFHALVTCQFNEEAAAPLAAQWLEWAKSHAQHIRPAFIEQAQHRRRSDRQLVAQIEAALDSDDCDAQIYAIISDPADAQVPLFRRTSDDDLNYLVQEAAVLIARLQIVDQSIKKAYDRLCDDISRIPDIEAERRNRRASMREAINAAKPCGSISEMSKLSYAERQELDFARACLIVENRIGSIQLGQSHPVRGLRELRQLTALVSDYALPRWERTTDVLKFLSIAMAVESDPASSILVFTCKLSSKVLNDASDARHGMKRHLQDRLSQLLRSHRIDCTPAFVFEAYPNTHVHGILSLPKCATGNGASLRDGLKSTLEKWSVGQLESASPSVVQVKPPSEPLGWVLYSCKRLGATSNQLSSASSLCAPNILRSSAKNAYSELQLLWNRDVKRTPP